MYQNRKPDGITEASLHPGMRTPGKKRLLCLLCAMLGVILLGMNATFLPVLGAEDVIASTRMLGPDDFTVPDEITMEKNGDKGFTVSNNIIWENTMQKGFHMLSTVRVDVDKVPLFTVCVQDCDAQYDVSFKAEDGVVHYLNQDKDAADWRRGNNTHTVNLHELYGWTGVHQLEIDFAYIVWGVGPIDDFQTVVNTFAYLGFKEDKTNDVITDTRMLGPDDFNVPGAVSFDKTGETSFAISNNTKWKQKIQKSYHMTAEVTVDVDKVPIFSVVALDCGAQYDISYKAEDGVVHYLNQGKDAADWRWGMNGHAVNLHDRHGWTGVHRITVDFSYITWDTAPTEELHSVVNNFAYLGFSRNGTFSVSQLYADGAILQREMPITVSGKATPGASVSVRLFKTGEKDPVAKSDAKTAENGEFFTELPAQKGGYDTYEMVITDGISTKTVRDLLFGEVWLAGGQSNMVFRLDWSVEGQQMKKEDANDPYLRGFFYSGAPTTWVKGDNLRQISNLSAAGYHFAEILRRQLDLPVGVVCNASGSTQIYSWLSEQALEESADLKAYAKNRVGNGIGSNFRTRVKPLGGYTVRGLLWYQGESNCGDESGFYSGAMKLLRKEWGDLFGWKNGTMPLIVSHLAPHFYLNERGFDDPPLFTEELNAIVRSAPEVTAQITVYDLPLEFKSTSRNMTPAPIHPAIKTDVGRRMAESALALVYGIGTEATAPVLGRMEVKGSAVYLTFDHVGDGLACLGKELHGFAIRSGSVFVPAHAEIVGKDTVKLTSPYVKDPTDATYAWTMMNQGANLVSTKDGKTLFAAVPFRTTTEKNVKYYRPHDWTYCDDEKLWRSACSTAGYVDAWKSASGKVSFDAENAFRGDAALKLDYTADQNGVITVSPKLDSGFEPSADFDPDYSDFRIIRLMVKNGSEGELKVSAVRFTDSEGNVYEAPADAVLAKEDGWKAVRVEIDGKLRRGDSPADLSALKNVKSVDFVFETAAGAKGVLYLDDIILSAEVSEEPAETEPETSAPDTSAADTRENGTSGDEKKEEPARIPAALIAAIAVGAVLVIGAVIVFVKKKH